MISVEEAIRKLRSLSLQSSEILAQLSPSDKDYVVATILREAFTRRQSSGEPESSYPPGVM